MLLGIIIGLLVGAGMMHLINKKKVDGLNKGILSNVKNLQDVQAKLKSTRNQLYRKRATYNKKRNGSNGKKAVKKKKASANTKKTNI
jgi:hypothetical protein